ncbi:uncharacterized protein LOC129578502 isoform X2 [Sitodiplosis mosellana]|nr:uncharacterized protein LOC129578502 isoform X2 [Sitodiplosis mosellana]
MIVALKNKISLHRLNETITVIDKSDETIRRIITFCRESQNLSSRLHDRSQIYLKSITEIIRILYAQIRILESVSLPDIVEIMYEPLEELPVRMKFPENIEVFTTDHLKNFYNVFLYFQSQYLLRFYLMIHFDPENGIKYLNNENTCFEKNIKMHTEKLVSWLDTKINQQFEQRKRLDSLRLEINNMSNVDLLKMKKFSMDVFCRLIAITNKYQNIDERIHSLEINAHLNEDEMLKISVEIDQIKGSIDTCQGDLEALKLINNKCFVQTFPLPIESNANSSETTSVNLSNISKSDESRKYDSDDESQEYFGMNICENGEHENTDGKSANWQNTYGKYSLQEELDNVDIKVTRTCFAPVLKQLKSIIDPIKTEMKERELKYLMSKGLDRDKIIMFDEQEDDHVPENPLETRTKSSKDRYDETRSFLQEKQQIMLMTLNALPTPSRLEDILE